MGKSWWLKALDGGYYQRRGFECEYPFGYGFIPAASNNFTTMNRDAGDIEQIVIHITGSPSVGKAINTFAAGSNPDKTSAHYVVDQEGNIYQMVKEKDRAHHASSANRSSIGIEHAASNKHGPSDVQYLSSAHLVRYLAEKYGVAMDRAHILGHQEAASTSHNCPGPLWDWPNYMKMVYRANPHSHPFYSDEWAIMANA